MIFDIFFEMKLQFCRLLSKSPLIQSSCWLWGKDDAYYYELPQTSSVSSAISLIFMRKQLYGCWSGHSLLYMGNNGASELWGIDLSAKQIEYADDLLKQHGLLTT